MPLYIMSVLCFCFFSPLLEASNDDNCISPWLLCICYPVLRRPFPVSCWLLMLVLCLTVPCLRRAASVEEEYEAAGGEVLLDDEDNDGWLATHGKPKGMSYVLQLDWRHGYCAVALIIWSHAFAILFFRNQIWWRWEFTFHGKPRNQQKEFH